MSTIDFFFESRVLAVANHPGAANAIVPVLLRLKRAKAEVLVLVSPLAEAICTEASIAVETVKSFFTVEAAEEVIKRFSPDFILLGTSEPEDPLLGRLEAVCAAAAKKMNIASVSVLDYWTGYRDRFSLNSRQELDALPDRICVMDTKAKDTMISDGFPPEKIYLTGNPHWDKLEAISRNLAAVDRKKLRGVFGIEESTTMVLFISQPLSDRRFLKHAYTESDVLSDILSILSGRQEAVLCIKVHPRQNPEDFSWVEGVLGKNRVKIISGNTYDLYHLGLAADNVIGMYSMLLVEYALLGIPVISYQPVSGNDRLVELGYRIDTVFSLAELKTRLEQMCPNSLRKISQEAVALNAAGRILAVIKDVLQPRIQV